MRRPRGGRRWARCSAHCRSARRSFAVSSRKKSCLAVRCVSTKARNRSDWAWSRCLANACSCSGEPGVCAAWERAGSTRRACLHAREPEPLDGAAERRDVADGPDAVAELGKVLPQHVLRRVDQKLDNLPLVVLGQDAGRAGLRLVIVVEVHKVRLAELVHDPLHGWDGDA